MSTELPGRTGAWAEIPLRDYFRQKNCGLTRDELDDIIREITSETDPDRLASIARHLLHLLERYPLPGDPSPLHRAWEQRSDHNREANWEIRRVAWEARLEMERQRLRTEATPPPEILTERVCQSIRWDPQPKVLDELVDYPPLPEGYPPQFSIPECIAQSWLSRLEENRPEDENGVWILRRGLETIRRKQQASCFSQGNPEGG